VVTADAALASRRRLRPARLVVEEGWPVAHSARLFGVAWTTPDRWASRNRIEGVAEMADRSMRPHTSPNETSPQVPKRRVSLSLRKRWGAVRLAAEASVAPSTAGVILRRCGLHRLSRLDRVEHQVVRYEHEAPGDLLRVGVKAKANRHADGGWVRSRYHQPLRRHGFGHLVLGDPSSPRQAPRSVATPGGLARTASGKSLVVGCGTAPEERPGVMRREQSSSSPVPVRLGMPGSLTATGSLHQKAQLVPCPASGRLGGRGSGVRA
jgi:hypothetical protein